MLLSQVKLLVILFITSIAIGSELEEHWKSYSKFQKIRMWSYRELLKETFKFHLEVEFSFS
jgi:hypothetical protein